MTETSPTAQRREVGTLLRAHRVRMGLQLAEAADQAGMSAAKLSRLERGLRGLQTGDVRTLCAIYRLSETETRELLAATRASREPGWWAGFGDLGSDAPMFFGLESAATAIEEFSPLLIPGLLQTEEYARAIMWEHPQTRGAGEGVIAERVEARLLRSSLLLPKQDRAFHFVIDEAALRRRVGSARLMQRQMHALRSAAAAANVLIRVAPFDAGAHACVDGHFIIQAFDGARQRDVVFLEGLAGTLLIDQVPQVQLYRVAFEELVEKALSGSGSKRLLQRIEQEWTLLGAEEESRASGA